MSSKARQYNMYEAKTHLSQIVAEAQRGHEVILMLRGVPVAKVVQIDAVPVKRRLGFAPDIQMLEGFNEIPEGFEDYV